MTNDEFRKAVNASETKDYFNSIELEVNYPPSRTKYTLKGLSDIHKFYSNQILSWEGKYGDIRQFQSSFGHFKEQLSAIEGYFGSFKNKDESTAGNQWMHIYQNFSKEFKFFVSESPVVDFLLGIHENEPNYFNGARDFFQGGNVGNSTYDFTGFIKAYEFDNVETSIIAQRKASEKRSFASLKAQLRGSQTKLQKELDELYQREHERFEILNNSIDEVKGERVGDFDGWYVKAKDSVTKLFDTTNKQAEDLVKSFKEQTRLKEPAKYWEDRGKVLNKEGWLAIKWLAGLVVFACLTLYALLWLTPEGMLLSFIEGEASAIKWSVVYVTFISFLAIGIRSLNKVAFSSFHLARDAQERHQLTHVYLALIADKDVDISESDRQLILQSLFSRSETGLLRQDSTPSMPTNIIEKYINPKG